MGEMSEMMLGMSASEEEEENETERNYIQPQL